MKTMNVVGIALVLMAGGGCCLFKEDRSKIPPPTARFSFIRMEYHNAADKMVEVWYSDHIWHTQTYKVIDGTITDYKEGSGWLSDALTALYSLTQASAYTPARPDSNLTSVNVKITGRAYDRTMLQWTGNLSQVPSEITACFFAMEVYEPEEVNSITSYLRASPDPGLDEDKELLVFETDPNTLFGNYIEGVCRFPGKLIPIRDFPPSNPYTMEKPYVPEGKIKARVKDEIYLIETFPKGASKAQDKQGQ